MGQSEGGGAGAINLVFMKEVHGIASYQIHWIVSLAKIESYRRNKKKQNKKSTDCTVYTEYETPLTKKGTNNLAL